MNSLNISSDLLLKIKHNINNKHCSLNTKDFNKIKINDRILLKSKFSDLLVKVKNTEKYDTFVEMASIHGIENIISETKDLNDSIKKYYDYYLLDKKFKYGGIMLTFEPISSISLTCFK